MKKWILSLSLAAGVIGLSACGNNDASDVVVETSAGNITKDELYEAMKEQIGQQALQELLYSKVLSEKYKVSDEEVNAKVDELKQDLGANFELVLQQNQIKDEKELKEIIKDQLLMEKAAMKDLKATDEEMQEYYDNYKPEVKARHILVEEEAVAKEIKQKLDEGAKFEDLAKEYSKDPGSAQNGGDLGWFGPNKMVPEFEAASYALEVNEISNPVKTEHGWHVIQVTEKKEKKSFEEMKEEIEYEVKLAKIDTQVMQDTIKRELDAANVKIKDKDLEGILDHGTQNS